MRPVFRIPNFCLDCSHLQNRIPTAPYPQKYYCDVSNHSIAKARDDGECRYRDEKKTEDAEEESATT